MFVIVSYDIVDDRRRARVLRLLRGYGAHVQRSVFECELDERRLSEVFSALRDLIEPREDDVRCYLLDAAAVRRIRTLGVARVARLPAYFLVGDGS